MLFVSKSVFKDGSRSKLNKAHCLELALQVEWNVMYTYTVPGGWNLYIRFRLPQELSSLDPEPESQNYEDPRIKIQV